MADIQFLRFDAVGARAQRDTVAAIYGDAYAARIESGVPFASPEAFMERFDSHASDPLLAFVIAEADGEAVGQAWGCPVTPTIASAAGEGEAADVIPGGILAAGTRKYLLSGLLRCGRIHSDGAVCNRSMSGTVKVSTRTGKQATAYRCPPRASGGCSATIATKKLDPLIEELLFAHIATNAPRDDDELSASPDPDDPDATELADVQARLSKLRTGYAQGTVTDDSMFNIVPQLEARERKLKSDLAKKAKIRRGRMSRAQSAGDVRREWDAGDVGVRRAILSRYLKAIVVRKSALANTRLVDYSSIEPIWRTESDPVPDDFLTM